MGRLKRASGCSVTALDAMKEQLCIPCESKEAGLIWAPCLHAPNVSSLQTPSHSREDPFIFPHFHVKLFLVPRWGNGIFRQTQHETHSASNPTCPNNSKNQHDHLYPIRPIATRLQSSGEESVIVTIFQVAAFRGDNLTRLHCHTVDKGWNQLGNTLVPAREQIFALQCAA